MTPDATGKISDMNPQCQCYSGREMILLATELEKAGYAIYRRAEKLAPTRRIAEVFHQMGQDELEHIRVLNQEIAPLFERNESSWESDEAVASYLKGRLDPDIFPDEEQLKKILKSIKTEAHAIDLCLDGEHKSVKFYKEMIDMIGNCYGDKCPGSAEAVQKIMAEEEKHVEKLKKLRQELENK